MSVDLGEFEAFVRKGCPVAAVDLTREQRTKLDAAIARPDITGISIVKVLKSWGREVSDTSVLRHRRRACRCYK